VACDKCQILEEGPAKEFGPFGGAFLLLTQSPIGAREGRWPSQDHPERRAGRDHQWGAMDARTWPGAQELDHRWVAGRPRGRAGLGRRLEVSGGVGIVATEPQDMWEIVEARRDAPVWTCLIGAPIDAVAPLERDVAPAGEVIHVYGEAVRRSRDSARRMGIDSSFVDIVARHLTQRVFEGKGACFAAPPSWGRR
jgi:hypothetical protein